MSQDFQFMKVSIVNKNPKSITTFFYLKVYMCATPNKSLEPLLVLNLITIYKKETIYTNKCLRKPYFFKFNFF